jgi:hypothetical protein
MPKEEPTDYTQEQRRRFAEQIISGEYEILVVGYQEPETKDGKPNPEAGQWWVWQDGDAIKSLGLADLLRDYCKGGIYDEGEDDDC